MMAPLIELVPPATVVVRSALSVMSPAVSELAVKFVAVAMVTGLYVWLPLV